ncbi:MAG: WGxxGxxG family protein [Aridibacter sp.]
MIMKLFNFFRFTRIGVLVFCLTILTAVSASAQNSNTNVTGMDRTEVQTVDRDNDIDWGWLGLLGLAGLAGLLPKKRAVEVRDTRTVRDDSTTNRT